MKTAILSVLAVAALGVTTAQSASMVIRDPGLVPYTIVDDNSIPKSLTGKAGDPANGRKLAINRKKGNCLACHVMPIPEQQFHGETAPSLYGVGKRLSEGELRLQLVNSKVTNESTLMPGVKDFLNWCKKENISMAVCTNKTEHLAVDLLKKIGIYDYFEYVAGYNTFDYCKPDPRHITTIIEILDGSKNKSIMIGDSESDANAAKAAEIPMILLEDGYTEKNIDEIYHNHLIKDFVGIEKIVSQYL